MHLKTCDIILMYNLIIIIFGLRGLVVSLLEIRYISANF